jgi:Uma2 family endonuclease
MKPMQPTTEQPADLTPQEIEELPVIATDLPVLFEDEGQEEMGESTPHTDSIQILTLALAEHCRSMPLCRVLSNLNVHYHPVNRRAYISPDVMVMQTAQPLPERLTSYRIRKDHPPPILVIEVLSRRSAQQQDLTNKPEIYAELGVAEYILFDPTGDFLEDRLLLKRRVDEQTWADEQDRDGGVTSRLGFRILIDDDGLPRVVETATGRRYLRPLEAEAAVKAEGAAKRKAETAAQAAEEARQKAEEAQRKAEQRSRDLEAELQRLRAEQSGGGKAG